MSGSPATPFSDNWTYLKTELQWLEKLLMLAIARRRQDDKVVNRLSKNQADKATSHWWQGLVTFDQQPAYDEAPAKQAMLKTAVVSTSKPGYQQQLEARIQASHQQGVLLGLPLLRDQLGLSQFEKNIVLMAIAPEINQRYAKLYQSLQAIGRTCGYELPTVDLALRLLCRNDQEWRAARMQLSSNSPLLRQGILEFCCDAEEALLNYRLKLAPDWVNYLIADPPKVEHIRSLLEHELLPNLPATMPTTRWQDLVLPADLVAQVRSQASVLHSENSDTQTGRILLLTGSSGSGKTAIAEALAYEHQQSLWQADLATLSITEQQQLLQDANFQTAPVVAIDSAHLWFGRQSSPSVNYRQQGAAIKSESIDSAVLSRWLTQRQQTAGITILTTHFLQSIRPTWRQQFDQVLQLCVPDSAARQTLWQRYLSGAEIDANFDWSNLAHKVKLTAGEIQTVAQSAIALAQLDQSVIQWQHVQQALQQHGHRRSQR